MVGRLTRSFPRGVRADCDSMVSASLRSSSTRRQRLIEQRALVGETDTAGAALEQLHTDALLQFSDILADGRCRDSEQASGRHKAQGFRRAKYEGNEAAQAVRYRPD